MSEWDRFSRTATSTGGDFPDRPYVRPGSYHGAVIRVSEPFDSANSQSGEMQTKFVVDFELSGGRIKGEKPVLPAFITLPPKYLDEGFLSEKANLYKLLKAFGHDMDGEFMVDPPAWPDTESCDVIVEDGEKPDANGNVQSWITKFLPCSCAEGDEPAPPKRPVAGGRRENWND